jgi:hypothetical protein
MTEAEPDPSWLGGAESYDVVVLGTGLKECILSGLLSVEGLKVRFPMLKLLTFDQPERDTQLI